MATLMLGWGGCTNGCRGTPQEAPAPAVQPLVRGSIPFSFDYQGINTVMIVKADPMTGERWVAVLSRADAKTDEWKISRGDGKPLLDRRGDGGFVLHLLDTMRTLSVEQPGIEGSHGSLGLAPPRFAIQWKVGEQEHELRVGQRSTDGGGVYAWIPSQAPFVAKGAALAMLDYLKTFDSLRLKAWSGLTSDDVDEIEADGFYAQREGSQWTGRDHKPLKAPIDSQLDKLTHERVKEFVDDATQAASLKKRIEAQGRKLTLKDRRGHATVLRVASIDNKWFALSSARPEGVFEVFADSGKAIAFK